MENKKASTVFAIAGAICWSVQLVPQIVLNYRRGHARGLQASMMLLWAFAGVPLGVYNISHSLHVALQVQAQILTTLSLVTWSQCLYYNYKRSIGTVVVVSVALGAILAAIEVGLVFATRKAIANHQGWVSILMAVLSALLLALGVLRHYWDIYQEKTVRGISFLFVGIDAAGDLTSLISLCFHQPFDILGSVIYGTEFVLWMGIFACAIFVGRGENESEEHDADADANANTNPDIALDNMPTEPRRESGHPRQSRSSNSVHSSQPVSERTTARRGTDSETASIRSRRSAHSVFFTASLHSTKE